MAHKQSNSEKTNTAGRYLFDGTCRYFTLFCTSMLIVAAIVGSAYPPSFLMLLPFAFCVASANAIYRFSPLSSAARHVLHFLVCMVGFFFAYLPWLLSDKNPGRYTFVLFLLAALVYLLGLAVFLIIKHARGKKKNADTPYESQFANLKK